MGSLPALSVLLGEERQLPQQPLHHMLEERLRSRGNKEHTAVITHESGLVKKLSYGSLSSSSWQLARALLEVFSQQQLESNTDGDFIVAVSMLPSDKLIVTLLSIWKSGAAYLPLDPAFPTQRTQHILAEARPALLIHDDDADVSAFSGVLSMPHSSLLQLAASQPGEEFPQELCLQQSTPGLAIVLYTSGSTGVPKGVRLPHHVIQNRLQWQYATFPFSPSELTCVFKTALTFVDSICELWGPLLMGRRVLVVPKHITRDPQQLVELLTQYKIERLVLVPSLLQSLTMYSSLSLQRPLPQLRLWVCSGEPLTCRAVRDFFSRLGGSHRKLCNFYGSTEVMADVTYCCITNVEQLEGMEKVPIGKPVFNTSIYLLDSSLQVVREGEAGQLWVAGSNLASGYVAGRSQDSFREIPLQGNQGSSRMYCTGDFARVVKGALVYEGRTDSQIKIRGHRVDLAEVEKALTNLKEVEKGVVLCYKAGEMEQALLGFVTLKDGARATGLMLEDLLQDKLNNYMIPQIIILESIPLLVNGKNDRQALLKMYENTNNNDDSAVQLDFDFSGVSPPQQQAAETLFRTVGAVIGRSARTTLSLSSNYYQLGGNSLNSIYTITQLKEQGYNIGITDFITAKNLGQVLQRMCREGEEEESSSSSRDTQYVAETLQPEHQDECQMMIVESFYEKADLEQWLKPGITREDYQELLQQGWPLLVEKGLSFAVRDPPGPAGQGRLVAVALSFDAHDEPPLEITTELATIFEFLEYIEAPCRDKLPQGVGQVLHNFMMATHPALSPAENVAAIHYMETRLLQLARDKHYQGIMATNTSPLTQQLGTDVFGYEKLLDYQVNQFVMDGGRVPFQRAPDDQRAVVCWRKVSS